MAEIKDKVITVDSLKAKHDYDENTYLKKSEALTTIGVTATVEELNRLDGVTSNIQTQLNDKAANVHNHDNLYLSVDGGIINGDTNIDGVLKVQGQQAFYYDTNAESQVVGTNNATGGTVICAGSDANVVVNGAKLLTANIAPRDSGSYGIGDSDNRYYSVYLRVSPNVDSDERLKRNIVYMDNDVLADFISKLNVVSYNYNDDADGAEAKIGLIAQNVKQANENISKYFVEENDNGYYSLRPSDFVFPLIASVKKLTREVEELKAKLG